MAKYIDIHPENPEPRAIAQLVKIIEGNGLIAYPTDSGYALGCLLGNAAGLERIRKIRNLDKKHHFTLVVSDFARLGQYVEMDNQIFRAVKAATPGRYTFILKATRVLPKAMLHPKKKTVGIRIPEYIPALALLDSLDKPLMSSTLILPDQNEAMNDGWTVKDTLDNELDAVLEAGPVSSVPTTVVDMSEGEPKILRIGGGDPSIFE